MTSSTAAAAVQDSDDRIWAMCFGPELASRQDVYAEAERCHKSVNAYAWESACIAAHNGMIRCGAREAYQSLCSQLRVSADRVCE